MVPQEIKTVLRVFANSLYAIVVLAASAIAYQWLMTGPDMLSGAFVSINETVVSFATSHTSAVGEWVRAHTSTLPIGKGLFFLEVLGAIHYSISTLLKKIGLSW